MALSKYNGNEEREDKEWEILYYPYNSEEYHEIEYIRDPIKAKFGPILDTVQSLQKLATIAIAVGDGLTSFRKIKRQWEKSSILAIQKSIVIFNLQQLRKDVISKRSICKFPGCNNCTKQNSEVCGLHKKECSECYSRFCTERMSILINDIDATCEECTPRCYKCGYPEDETMDMCFYCS